MIWSVLGWLGNVCYFSRFLLQWLQSERARRSVTPRSFWWLSLGGCAFLGTCAIAQRELVLVPSFLINGAIYARNLWIDRSRGRGGRLGPLPAALAGLAAATVVVAFLLLKDDTPTSEDAWWLLLVGAVGQGLWSVRFILQWWFTERRGYSHFPLAFWWITLVGSVLNIAYTATRDDPVYLFGLLPTPIYPIRNLMIERARRRRERAAAAEAPSEIGVREPTA